VAGAAPLALEVEQVEVGFDQRTNEPVISFRLTEASGRQFAAFTSANVGKKAALRVDGRTLVEPVIREPILGGAGQISAGLKVEEARDLADRLSSGRAKMEVEAVAE